MRYKFVRVVVTFSHISNAQSGDEITGFGLVLWKCAHFVNTNPNAISYYLQKQTKIATLRASRCNRTRLSSRVLYNSSGCEEFSHLLARSEMSNRAKIVVVLISRRFFDIRPPCIYWASKKIFCELMLPLHVWLHIREM